MAYTSWADEVNDEEEQKALLAASQISQYTTVDVVQTERKEEVEEFCTFNTLLEIIPEEEEEEEEEKGYEASFNDGASFHTATSFISGKSDYATAPSSPVGSLEKSMNDIPLPEDLKERATAKVASRMDRLNKTGESWRMNREAEDVEDGSSVDKEACEHTPPLEETSESTSPSTEEFEAEGSEMLVSTSDETVIVLEEVSTPPHMPSSPADVFELDRCIYRKDQPLPTQTSEENAEGYQNIHNLLQLLETSVQSPSSPQHVSQENQGILRNSQQQLPQTSEEGRHLDNLLQTAVKDYEALGKNKLRPDTECFKPRQR